MLPVDRSAAVLATVDASAVIEGAETATAVAVARAAPAGKKAAATARRRQRKPATASVLALDTSSEGDASASRAHHSVSSDEEKKEKNRNSVRRSYYRKIETLGELRIHADDLRQQYNEMLQRWESRYLATAGANAATGAANAPTSSKSELLLRYMELSRLRDELWAENQQLHDAFEDREKSVFRLQRLFDVNYQLMDHSAHASSRNPETVRFPSPALIMDEMSIEAFRGYAQDALAQVESFLAKKQEMTATHQVLGWMSSHIVEANAFRFYFEKPFALAPGVSASTVAQQAWAILTSPERHSELYARTLHVRFHVMQIFDTNSYVLYRTMEKEGEDSITTALLCMTRIPRGTRGGCLIICKGLKKAEHKLQLESMSEYTLHKKKIWRESMYWLSVDETLDDEDGRWEDAGDSDQKAPYRLRVAHGGIMKNMGERSPSFWLFENLLIALRWESKLGLESKKPSDAPPDATEALAHSRDERVEGGLL